MINIKNRQRKIPVNTQQLADAASAMLLAAGYPDFDLSILLTTNKSIRVFNKKFRGKDKPTDILSFPYYPKLKPGQKIKPLSDDEKYLGDLIISLEYALKDAPATWARPFREHLVALIAHGIAHLLGYDHLQDNDWALMQEQEKKLLQTVK